MTTPNKTTVEELLDKYFPKGKCKERGQAMMLVAEAHQQGEREGVERCVNIIKKTNPVLSGVGKVQAEWGADKLKIIILKAL